MENQELTYGLCDNFLDRINKNEFYYQVCELISTYDIRSDDMDPFEYIINFKGDDLSKMREDATKWLSDRESELNQNEKYFLPLDFNNETFKLRQHTNFDLFLTMIEIDKEDNLNEYPLIGTYDFTILLDSMEFESLLFKAKGLKFLELSKSSKAKQKEGLLEGVEVYYIRKQS